MNTQGFARAFNVLFRKENAMLFTGIFIVMAAFSYFIIGSGNVALFCTIVAGLFYVKDRIPTEEVKE